MQRRFPIDDILLLSGDIRDQVAKLSEIAPKFDVLGRQVSGAGKWPPKCLTEFHKSRSPSTMCQSLVTIGQATSENRRRKKIETTAVKHNGCGWRAAIMKKKKMMMMVMMMDVETDSLLLSCADLESRLQRRRAELEQVKDFHAGYRQKMSQHRQSVELAETSQASKHETKRLTDRIQQLTTDS